MRYTSGVAAFAVLAALAVPAGAQQGQQAQQRQQQGQQAQQGQQQQQQGQAQAPRTPDQVARPGGRLDIPQLALVKVADGFQDPTSVAAANDGSGRIFVTERVGRVRVVDQNGTVAKDPFLDLTRINPLGSDVQTGFVEQGLYSIAFDPRFRENGHFYVHYASLPFNGDNMVVRFTVDPASPNTVSAEQANRTAKVILRVEQPWYNHNGGQLAFGPKDGFLYIGIGDGGWEGDPLRAGQDLSTHLGKILRIDVANVPDDYPLPYRIPASNPFSQASKARLMQLFGITEQQFATIRTASLPEIWAYGLRNPYSFAFDQETGDLFIADVGQNHWEEINFQPASSQGGENYGWAAMQGSFCHPITGPLEQRDGRFATQANCPVVGVLPAAEYPHENPYPGAQAVKQATGCSVQGMGVGNFQGRKVYLSGDWCSGRLWGLAWDQRAGSWQFAELAQTDLQFTSGGRGEDGTIYAVNCNCFYIGERGPTQNPPGALWKIVPQDQVAQGAEVARTRARQD